MERVKRMELLPQTQDGCASRNGAWRAKEADNLPDQHRNGDAGEYRDRQRQKQKRKSFAFEGGAVFD
jgi:hypothetical protein